MTRRPHRSLEEFANYVALRGWSPRTIIDIGACYGTPELLQGFPEAYHILIEPLEELRERLELITTKYRGEHHLCAMADIEGEMALSVPPNGLQGASFAPSGHANTRAVPVHRLDDLLAGRDLEGPILLKTDCQGFDLHALKGAVVTLRHTDLVVAEVNMFHPASNPELPDFGEIVGWMREQDFAVFDIVSYQTRPFDEALGYVDLVFARNDSAFRRHHRWQ